ncbi:hypothetical protein VYU27_010547, partial [Nannochloropsis oceanica]
HVQVITKRIVALHSSVPPSVPPSLPPPSAVAGPRGKGNEGVEELLQTPVRVSRRRRRRSSVDPPGVSSSSSFPSLPGRGKGGREGGGEGGRGRGRAWSSSLPCHPASGGGPEGEGGREGEGGERERGLLPPCTCPSLPLSSSSADEKDEAQAGGEKEEEEEEEEEKEEENEGEEEEENEEEEAEEKEEEEGEGEGGRLEGREGGLLVDEDGKGYEVDVVIFATGFAVNDSLSQVRVVGRNGVVLEEKIRERGWTSYLGVTTQDMPNFGTTLGSNTALGLSLPPSLLPFVLV